MLQDIEVQSKEEGAAEAALFQKFEYWCSTTSKALEKTIAKEKATIAELDDKSAGLKADIATLGEEIETLTKELETRNAAAAKAKQVREEELELYNEDVKNLKRTTGAVHTAVEVMEEDSEALIQKPAAKTYTNKAGGVIETFKGMEKGFEGDTLDAHQQEANKKKAYALAKQAQDFAIKAAEDSKAEKEGIKGDKEAELADAGSAREQEQSALETDSVSLDDTHKECTTKTEEWNQRSAVRAGEIQAIQMAQKVLSKVTGVRNPDEHEIPTKSLLAFSRITQDSSNFRIVTSAVSLLQVDDPRVKAVNLLRQAATKGHSKALQDLAEQLRTYDGPFDKIKGMMQKMIFRLMSEQKDEDDHKNWCDLETEKNTESKTDKKSKMDELQGKISEMDAAIKLLVEKIADNDAKVKEIEEYVASETELRDENHAEILATIKDSQDAQKAVTQATGVLKDFYKNS